MVIQHRVKHAILKKYKHDGIVSFKQKVNIINRSYKYVLVPLYIGHITYENKVYNFYMNGYTGRIVGSAPVSVLKVTLFILIILLIVGLFILIPFMLI